MKITICGSLNFTPQIKILADKLKKFGYQVQIPLTSERILNHEFTLEEIKQEKNNGKFHERAIKYNSIKAYHEIIKKSDAILVANFDKNNIKNYIGGNTFLEMGFAFIHNKKIFILNNIPELNYTDEIKAMQPIILNNNLSKINKFIPINIAKTNLKLK